MNNPIVIAVDAMGGDNSPDKVIDGIELYSKENKNIFYKLFGDKNLIQQSLKNKKIDVDIYEIIHTEESIKGEDSALTAAKRGKNTSMWLSIESVKNKKSDIVLSAGNTGALFVIAKLNLDMIDNIDKPALSGLWPNKLGMNVVLDLGANIECNEQNLIDFAEMGSALYKALFPDQLPKVSLLNVGSEEIKGTEILKNSSKKLKDLSNENNFIYKGYIEGNSIMSGESNVIVTDGFTGNIALKTAEGTAKFITDNLKKNLTKISLLFSYFSLKKFKSKLDPRKYNGAIFLGLNGPVVKSHGGTDSVGFYYSIDLCYKIVKGNLMQQIKKNLSHLKSEN